MLTKHAKIRIFLKLIGDERHLPKHEQGSSQKLAVTFMDEFGLTLKQVNEYCIKMEDRRAKAEIKDKQQELIK